MDLDSSQFVSFKSKKRLFASMINSFYMELKLLSSYHCAYITIRYYSDFLTFLSAFVKFCFLTQVLQE